MTIIPKIQPLPYAQEILRADEKEFMMKLNQIKFNEMNILFSVALEECRNNKDTRIPTLWKIVHYSKEHPSEGNAAKWALHIIKALGIRLSYRDMRGVNIPEADLSGILWTGSDFSWANLRAANLVNVGFNNVKCVGTILTGVKIGRPPYLLHDFPVLSYIFTPNDSHLICKDKYFFYKWDLNSYQLVQKIRFETTEGKIRFHFPPNRNSLLMTQHTRDTLTFTIWNIESLDKLDSISLSLRSHDQFFFTVDANDQTWLIFICQKTNSENELIFWKLDLINFKISLTRSHTKILSTKFEQFCVSTQKGLLVTLTNQREAQIQFWTFPECNFLQTWVEEKYINHLEFSSDEESLILVNDEEVYSYSLQLQKKRHSFFKDKNPKGVIFLDEHPYILYYSSERICIRDIKTRNFVCQVEFFTREISFSHDEQMLITRDKDRITLWNMETISQYQKKIPKGDIQQIEFDEDGHQVEIKASSRYYQIDLSTGKQIEKIKIFSKYKTKPHINYECYNELNPIYPDQIKPKTFIHQTLYRFVELISDNNVIVRFEGPFQAITHFEDFKFLAFLTRNEIEIWNTSPISKQFSFTIPYSSQNTNYQLTGCYFDQDQIYLCLSKNDIIFIWHLNIVTKKLELHTQFKSPIGPPRSLTFHKNQWLEAHSGCEVLLWNPKTQKPFFLKTKMKTVYNYQETHCDISPNGSLLATSFSGAPVLHSANLCLWKLPELFLLTELPLKETVSTLQFSPDGNRLLVGCLGGQLKCYEIENEMLYDVWQIHPTLDLNGFELSSIGKESEREKLLLEQQQKIPLHRYHPLSDYF